MGKDEPYIVIGNEVTFIQDAGPKEAPSAWGTVAFVALGLGLTAISIHWVAILDPGILAFGIILGIGITAAAVGMLSSLGLVIDGSNLGKDFYGFYGLLLGLGAVILAISMYLITKLLVWG
jgi:hypothetical protein